MIKVNIDGFEIKRELFSTKNGLTVYEVIEAGSGESCILRLADFSNKMGKQDQWYQLFDEYQMTVTNFKHLPRVMTINILDENRLYTVLDGEAGKPLKEKGKMGLDEILQLIEAVRHLHRKKMVHGSICAENIWLTHNGRIILYGAGEDYVLDSQSQQRFSSDILQISKVIRDYSDLSEEVLDRLETVRPVTVEELEMLLTKGEITDDLKRKGGLVEKEKPRVVYTPTSFVERPTTTQNEKYKQNQNQDTNRRPNQNSFQSPNQNHNRKPMVEQNQVNPRENQQDRQTQQQAKRKGSWVWKTILVVAAILVIFFVIGKVTDGNKPGQSVAPAAVQQSKVAPKSNDTAGQKVEKSVVQQETPAATFTTSEVTDFFGEYLRLSVESINQRDFSVVESLVDPNGKKYKEQRDYTKYLAEKNITEELLNYQAVDVVHVDKTTYKIATNEKYRIIYSDGSEKVKSFKSSYRIKILQDGRLAVNELLNLKEITSN